MRAWLLARPLVMATALLALAGCSSDEPGPQSRAPAAYAGMDACRSCHLGVHSTYAHNGMARSFRSLDEGEAGFGAPAWIVGSGKHLSAVLVERSGGLERAPVCRQAGSKDWEPCPDGAPGQHHVSGGREVDACRGCHDVADPQRVEAPRGVDCERCHGPGTAHIERWKGASEGGTGLADPTIVNPRRLADAPRMAVCLQCHLGDSPSVARVLRIGSSSTDAFRPGMPLDALWISWRLARPSPLEFGIGGQGDRLMRSRCYLASDGRMDCTTCHNPHVSVYHEDRPADLFRLQCLGCHAEEDCPAPVDARSRTSPADDCVDCHMRQGEPVDQSGTLHTDHWIRRTPGAEAADTAEACELEPVLPQSTGGATEGELAYYRASAWIELAGRDGDHPCAEARDRALDDLARAVENGFDLPEKELGTFRE